MINMELTYWYTFECIPGSTIKREWAPGEVKRIPFGELEKLTYQPGGRELIANFLQIMENEA